jgi:uncharacterized protein
MEPLPELIAAMALVDHHCHGVVGGVLDRAGFEALLTEAAGPGRLGGSLVDSAIGLAVRRWCPPVLDLPPHTPIDAYLARRAELGVAEVSRRFLRGAGLAAVLVDTGYAPEPDATPAALGEAAGAPSYEVVRLETLAEQVAHEDGSASDFAGAVQERLAEAAKRPGVVAVKSIAAYRVGLDLAGERPGSAEVVAAAGRLLAAPGRVADQVLHRWLMFAGADLGLPLQIHCGYGDRDLDLHRCDPLLLTGLLRGLEPTGVPVVLLHNYPYHRHAGYLAQVFGNVFVDIGLALHHVGERAGVLLAEVLELAPFGKVLYSSDGYGLPEHHHLASVLFRRALSGLLADAVAADACAHRDAARLAGLICGDNARRVYGLPAGPESPDAKPRSVNCR